MPKKTEIQNPSAPHMKWRGLMRKIRNIISTIIDGTQAITHDNTSNH